MFFNLMAGDSVKRDLLNMIYGFERFLDRHTGVIPKDASVEDMSKWVINETGLVCNELHYLDKGGNGTPSGTCTSEAQSFHILGYIWLYKATGDVYFLERAKYFWQAYFDQLYLGVPLPKDENQILHAHWMINVKREFPSAYPNNFDNGSSAGFLGVEIEFTDNVAMIAPGAPFYGEQLQLVTQAFNVDDRLTYASVKASVATATWAASKAYQVKSFINHQGWKLGPDGDRLDELVYPDDQKGRVELSGKVFLKTVGEGRQLPSEVVNGPMKLCFSTNNGVLIRQKKPFDPRPVWAPLVEGTQGNAADGEEWFLDACLMLWEITDEDKYRLMYKTCINTIKSYCSIDSSLRIFRKDPIARSPHTDGISYSYSYPSKPSEAELTRIQSPKTHPYFGCIKVDCRAGVYDEQGKHSTWMENSGTWYKVAPTSKISWEIAVENEDNVGMRYIIEVSATKVDSGVTKRYRCPQFERLALDPQLKAREAVLDGACTVTEDSPHFANVFFDETVAEINWRKVNVDSKDMWYRSLEWREDTPKGGECWLSIDAILPHTKKGVKTLEVIKHDNVITKLSGWSETVIEFTVFGGQVYRVNPGWLAMLDNQPNTVVSKDLSKVNPTSADGVLYWEQYDSVESVWTRMSAQSGNPIASLEVVGMKIIDLTPVSEVEPNHSPKGYSLIGVNNFHEEAWSGTEQTYILRNSLEFFTKDETLPRPIIYIGNCTIAEALDDQLAYTPGLVPFSNNWQPEANAYSSWRGMPYLAYQYPLVFRESQRHWDNMLNCLYDAQVDYPKGAAGRPLGPSRAAYVWNRSDNTGYGVADTFVDKFWGTAEPWNGYQPRITWSIGRAYYDQVIIRKEVADSRLVDMMTNWIDFIYDFLKANSDNFPTGFRSEGVPYDDGWNGHMVANYLSGVSMALMAGHPDTDGKAEYIIDTAINSFKQEYYVKPGDGSFHMNGCWSSWPLGGQFFGFWAGQIYQAFGSYLMYQNMKQGKKTY